MSTFSLRIFRSPVANYYADDILTGPQAYPEEYFAQLVQHGFNAVWLRGILRELSCSTVFPELAGEVARHQDALGVVVERAQAYGVGVLLYLNEPLCLPRAHPFWALHPEVRGDSGSSRMDAWPETSALCTSTAPVRAWLREVTANVFRALPELAGWFLISASEHHTHCYSHCVGAQMPSCPRCAARSRVDVVADLIGDLRDGTRASSPSARCIAWNWGWAECIEPDPQTTLLARLPKDVIVLADWERGGRHTMPDGREHVIDEYSLSYVGPSARFMEVYEAATQLGVSTMVKLQVGTTHELATVPNLPLVDHLYEKLRAAEALAVDGMLATWNFGNAFSLNTAAVAQFIADPQRPTTPVFVARLATQYFPGTDGAAVAGAIEQFSTAMAYFPFDLALLYYGPANYALAYPLTLAPLQGSSMGWSWMMHPRGDDLSEAAGQFTIEELIRYFAQLVPAWERGVALLDAALAACRHPHAAEEAGVARVIGCCYRSTLNVLRVYLLRRDRPAEMPEQFQRILADEIINLNMALPLVEADARLGFHAECQDYQFTAALLREKLAQLEAQRTE